MRAVVQRVAQARVDIAGECVGAIGPGVLVLLGISTEDHDALPKWLADKVCNLRIFEDDGGKMNRSLLESGGEALIVSQFTLYGDARRGRRPSFVRAASGPAARGLYESTIAAFKSLGVSTRSGEFGATMEVTLTNSGPTTLLLDSTKSF